MQIQVWYSEVVFPDNPDVFASLELITINWVRPEKMAAKDFKWPGGGESFGDSDLHSFKRVYVNHSSSR